MHACASSPRERKRGRPSLAGNLALAALLAAATLAVFWPLGGHEFVGLDDPDYVILNETVRHGLSAAAAARAFTTFHSSNWHPLTWLSHMADVSLFGVVPQPHHLVSLGWHVAGAILAFLVLQAFTGARWRSLGVAALFAVHPMHVESVAWIAERKDVLSGFFWLLTMGAYLAYARRPGWGRMSLVALSLCLGLMAKPMLVSVPLVLLVLDWWPLGRMRAVQAAGEASRGKRPGNLGALLREKAPLFALAAASSWLTILAQRHGEAVVSVQRIGLEARAANALAALAAYLGKMVWPRGLTLFYPHVGGAPAWGSVALGAALAGLLVVALRLRRTHPALLAGLLWYAISLGPVLGLVQVGYQSMADRYTYLPYLGAFIALAWGAERLAARSGRTAVAAAFGASILLMAVVAHRQVGYWRDGIALFSRYVRVLSRDYLPAAPTGGAGGERRYHERVVAVVPPLMEGHFQLARAYERAGRGDEAPASYAEVLRLTRQYAESSNRLGEFSLASGNQEAAARQFQEALRVDPGNPAARENLQRLRGGG